MGIDDTKDNIWDRIFKTLILQMPEMFLPLINEVFDEKYDDTAVITFLNNEFYNKDGSKVVSDTALMVNHMIYHFECQFSNDKEMAFRMFEYDFQIGLSDSKRTKSIDEFDFPRSCVVYITANTNNPQILKLKVNFPNGNFIYEVPTIRVQDYPLEKIGKKNLLIFLPYLVLKYPKKLKNKKPPTKEEIVKFYQEMLELLETAYNDSVIDIQEYNIILEAMREAEQRVFNDYMDIKREVDDMVSNTLELKSIKMRDEAVKKAANEAVKENNKNIKEKLKMLGLPEEQIQEVLEYATKKRKSSI